MFFNKPLGVFFFYSIIMLFFSMLFSASAATKVTVHGGQTRFYGKVVNAACTVEVGSRDQIVNMGVIRNSFFNNIGSWSGSVRFNIDLIDCSNNVSQYVTVFFRGLSDGKDPQVFKVRGGEGGARGIGIGIFDTEDNLFLPNTMPEWGMPINNGDTELKFVAKYRATDRVVTPGEASAEVWFSLYYQ